MIYKKIESEKTMCSSDSLLLALGEVMDRVQAFKLLLEQSKQTGLLPHLQTPCSGLLRELGYRQVTMKEHVVPAELTDYLNGLPASRFIVAVKHAGVHTAKQYAYVERRGDLWSYHGLKPLNDVCAICDVWSYEPDRKRRPRTIRVQARELDHDTDCMHFANPNPIGRSTGDCLIRGFSHLLGVGWIEAAATIARDSNYVSSQLNVESTFEQVLLKHGFLKVPVPMSYNADGDRAYMDGKHFCDWCDKTYHNGEYILTFVGNNHVVACYVEEKTNRYMMHDTWNSAVRKIKPYMYVGPAPASKRTVRQPLRLIEQPEAGMMLHHPVFGRGEVVLIDGKRMQVRFGAEDVRLMGTDWVCANCRPVHEMLPCA